MDRSQFDALARRVATKGSRRTALAAILGVTLLRHDPAAVLATRRGRGTLNAQAKVKAKAKAKPCYPGTNCAPGKGKNTSGCDFSFSTVLHNTDVRGANLSNSSFHGADLAGADFRGANLSGACLIGANLRDAKLGSSVNLGGAIFCNTIKPDGAVDDSGCGQTTACCPHVVQDCPDTTITCLQLDASNSCNLIVGFIRHVGTCWHSPKCCPCGHPDQAYWDQQCNQTFPGCNGRCKALDDEPFFANCLNCR